MHATLHIPQFPLAVLLRDDPEACQLPAALVSTGNRNPVLLAVNRLAARHRLAPGLTPTRALARCPRLQLFTADHSLEREHQEHLRQFAASFSPDFEHTAPGTFTLDLLTIPHARTRPADWIEHTLRQATPLRLPLHLAVASSPDLAHLGALHFRTASRLGFHPDPELHVQNPEIGIQSLAELPLSTLNANPQSPGSLPGPVGLPLDHDLLHLWGIATLGDLAALPRQGLAERLGPEASRLHDILHGKYQRLLNLHRPPQHFHTSQDLDHPLETLEPLLFLLRRSLGTLCARLAANQRAAAALTLSLTFGDDDVLQRALVLPEPSCAPDSLLQPLHTYLDTVRAPAPVTGYALGITPALPGESQHRLFEQSLRDPNKFADTLARLEALTGPGRLGTPVPLDTYRPDSFEVRGAGCGARQHEAFRSQVIGFPARHARPPAALPLKRFRPSIGIHLASEPRDRCHYPLAILTGPHRGSIHTAHGPFSFSGHWWSPHERWQRIEWDVQLDQGTLLRLAFIPPHQWLLEGIYA